MAEAPRVIVTSHDGAVVGDLDPARLVDMVVVDEVNGERSLTVTTTQELSKGDRLLWRDGMLRWREYVVEADEAEHSAGEATHAYWCPWSLQYDLSRTFVSAMPGTGGTPATAEQALEAALGGTARWAVGAVDVATTGSASFFRMSGWEALQTLVETWGGEVDATIEVGLAGVTSRSVSLLAHVGDEGATRRFDYGHDVAGIRRTVMDEPWTCRVIPLGKAEETEGGGYGRKVTIEDANGGVMWLEDADAVPLTRVPDGSGGWEHPVQVVENEAMETAADLKAWALEHLHDWTRPKVAYEATVAQLAEAGMDAQGVAVGDECYVVDATFGSVPIRIQTRLLRMEEHLLDHSQDALTFSNLVDGLGSQLDQIARGVAQVQSQVTDLSLNQSTAEYVSNLIARMNAEANATGGYTYITEGQGIRTYDRAVSDPLVGSEASQVVEIKGGNVRIANSRDSDGDWEWRTVIVSGHVASDLVTTAQLVAGRIESGDGTSWWDLDSNTMHFVGYASESDVDAIELMLHAYGQGVLLCRNGQTIGALVNANGSFDAVKVTWSGDVPTVGASYATFGPTSRIGATSSAHMAQTTTSTEFYDRNGALKLSLGTSSSSGYARIAANDLLEIASVVGAYSQSFMTMESNRIALYVNSTSGGILNSLTLFADSSGNPSYTVASPSAFRDAISAAGVGDQSTQNVVFGSGSGTTQQWTIVSNVNSSNAAHGGDRSALIVQDDTVRLLDSTTDTALWSAITTATAPSTSTNVPNVITAASGRTVSQCTYAEWGHVAQLSVTCSGFSASAGSQTVGTVVSGKRPVYAVYATGITSANAPYASLAADGTLSVYWGTAPSTSANYTIRFVYLLA